jgi:hypothetical protein
MWGIEHQRADAVATMYAAPPGGGVAEAAAELTEVTTLRDVSFNYCPGVK